MLFPHLLQALKISCNSPTTKNYQMIKKKLLLAIPLFIALATIIRCWIEILISNRIAQWQHYSAILCAIIVIYFFFKNLPQALIATGIFFVVGTVNGFSMTSNIETSWITIFGVPSPPFNSLAFGLLFLYFVLNFVTMVNLHLDNKERKNTLKTQGKILSDSIDNKIVN